LSDSCHHNSQQYRNSNMMYLRQYKNLVLHK